MVIYVIEFLDTDYFYIGSTKNYNNREWGHFGDLKKNKHANRFLQNVYNKYPDKIYMRIIDKAETQADLLNLEQAYIDTFNPPLNLSKDVRYPTGSRPSKLYEVVNKDGVIVRTNEVLEFCKKHNIDFTEFYKVARGQRLSCKGWKIVSIDGVKTKERIHKRYIPEYVVKNKETIKKMQKAKTKKSDEITSLKLSKKYLITTPDKIQFCVIGLNWFCKKENLDVTHLAKVARGDRKHHKGYLCEEIVSPEGTTTPKVG